MGQDNEADTLEFFKAQHAGFVDTLAAYRGRPDMLAALLSQAFSSFEGNVDILTKGEPELACHKGCAACCILRVVATAPEILLAARYIRTADGALKKAGIDLRARLAEADALTRGRGEGERVALRRRCPYIHQGACVIYPVRPLACRAHVSYDKRACAEAAAGRVEEVPYSASHMTVRSLVQNAMQSALRDAGYAWAAYEFNHALSLALDEEGCEATWLAGEDLFAPALVEDVSLAEMASTFDHIHGREAG